MIDFVNSPQVVDGAKTNAFYANYQKIQKIIEKDEIASKTSRNI